MKLWRIGSALILAGMVLGGCGSRQATPVTTSSGLGDTYVSKILTASYPNALMASSQLMLGTLKVEGTEQAVTLAQAKALLPLWQAFQGNVLQGSAERNATLAAIEGQMTPAQMDAIAALRLTQADLQAWAQGQGPMAMGPGGPGTAPGTQATRQPGSGGGTQGMPPDFGTRRAQLGDMSEAQRAAFRATAQAGGTRAGGGTNAGPTVSSFLLRPLIALLEARASGA